MQQYRINAGLMEFGHAGAWKVIKHFFVITLEELGRCLVLATDQTVSLKVMANPIQDIFFRTRLMKLRGNAMPRALNGVP